MAGGNLKADVLIVDDSTTVRQHLRSTLEGAGLDVTEASDGAQGLTEARAGKFDLFIVDINMPGMNGFELIHALRKEPRYSRTPIFALTTESTNDAVGKGKDLGATAWIVKPFNPESLIMGINMVLSSSKAR